MFLSPLLKKISNIYTLFDRFKRTKPINKLFIPEKLVNVYSSDMSNWTFLSYYSTIDEYNNAIQKFIGYIKEDKPIPQFLLPINERSVYVAEFFTHQNKYVNVAEKATDFLNSITELFELLKQIESGNTNLNYALRNLRLLAIVRGNLLIISKAINDQTA